MHHNRMSTFFRPTAMEYIFEGVGNELLTITIISYVIIVALLLRLDLFTTNYVNRIGQYLRRLFVNDNVSTSMMDSDAIQDNDQPLDVRIFNTDCCVCLSEDCNYPVTSICGHCFCGTCAINLIEHTRISVPLKCPLCRQECHALYIRFQESQNDEDVALRDMVKDSVTSYNTRAENRFPLVNRVRNAPVMLRHLVRSFITFRGNLIFRLKCHVLVAVLVAGCYLAISTDIIPERVFGLIGFIDDFIVITFLIVLVSRTYTGIDSSVTFDDIRAALE